MRLVEVCPLCGGEFHWVAVEPEPRDPNRQPMYRRECEKCGRPWDPDGPKTLEARTKEHRRGKR